MEESKRILEEIIEKKPSILAKTGLFLLDHTPVRAENFDVIQLAFHLLKISGANIDVHVLSKNKSELKQAIEHLKQDG